jgi:hypothetical protein
MKYARIVSNSVQEVFTPPDGFTIEECFHPDVVKLFEPVPDEVDVGWLKNPDGTFSAPPVVEPPAPEPSPEPA